MKKSLSSSRSRISGPQPEDASSNLVGDAIQKEYSGKFAELSLEDCRKAGKEAGEALNKI